MADKIVDDEHLDHARRGRPAGSDPVDGEHNYPQPGAPLELPTGPPEGEVARRLVIPQRNEFLASLLKTGSTAYASLTVAEMTGSQAETPSAPDSDPVPFWKTWIAERVKELAVAVSAAKPELFVQEVRWAVSLFAARGVPVANITHALEALRGVLAQELPSRVRPLADDYLARALPAIDAAASPEPEPPAADSAAGKLVAAYLDALWEGHPLKAISIIDDATNDGWSVPDLYLHVLAPAQREIGQRWLINQISTAEEHLATVTTRRTMAQLRGRTKAPPARGKTVVSAMVPEDLHDIGLQMASDFFEFDGWRTLFLGANVPTPDLVSALERYRADLLLLSAALTKNLTAVRDTIHAVRYHPPARGTQIVVGGLAFTGLTDLAEQYGADGYAADATEALRVGNRLVGLSD